MSKAQLQEAEAQLQRLQGEAKAKSAQVEQTKADLVRLKSAQDRLSAELDEERSQTMRLVAARDVEEESHAEKMKELDQLRAEAAGAAKALKAERDSLAVAEEAQKALQQGWEGLRAVRDELVALGSDAAKEAALSCAGADLPTEVVPAPTPQLGSEAGVAVADAEASEEVQRVLQAKAVITVLQHSLIVRAAELREGLRQWSFASTANTRTQDLCDALEKSKADAQEQTQALQLERVQVEVECKALTQEHSSRSGSYRDLESRHTEHSQELVESQAATKEKQAAHVAISDSLDSLERAHRRLKYEHDEACLTLTSQEKALDGHPAEEQRRLSAAVQLVAKAEEQVRRSHDELRQARQELKSFQQAHAVLKEANASLQEELDMERATTARLSGEREMLSMDLNALARHYLDALPPLPGLEEYSLRGESQGAAGNNKPRDGRRVSDDGSPLGALNAGGRLLMGVA